MRGHYTRMGIMPMDLMRNNTYRVYCQGKTLVVIPNRVDLFDCLCIQPEEIKDVYENELSCRVAV